MQRYTSHPNKTKQTPQKRTPNKKRKVLMIAGGAVLCLVVFIYFYFFTSPSQHATYHFNTQQERQVIAQPKYEQIQTLTTPAPSYSAPVQPQEVLLTELETNALLQEAIESDPKIRHEMSKVGVHDPVVTLKDNQVEFNARFRQAGVSVPVTMNFSIYPGMPNTMQLSLVSAHVGRMPLNEELKQKLVSAINSAAPGGVLKLPKGIAAIQINSGRLVIIPGERPVANPQQYPQQQNPYGY